MLCRRQNLRTILEIEVLKQIHFIKQSQYNTMNHRVAIKIWFPLFPQRRTEILFIFLFQFLFVFHTKSWFPHMHGCDFWMSSASWWWVWYLASLWLLPIAMKIKDIRGPDHLLSFQPSEALAHDIAFLTGFPCKPFVLSCWALQSMIGKYEFDTFWAKSKSTVYS